MTIEELIAFYNQAGLPVGNYGGSDSPTHLKVGDDDGRRTSYDEFIGNYSPWADAFSNTKDSQGRQSYGSKPFLQGVNPFYVDQSGVGRYRVPIETLNDQYRAVGGKDSDLTYDPTYGYSIPVALQEAWANQFQKSGTLEKIFNNMPLALGAAVGGMGLSGAGLGGGAAGAAGALPESYWGMLAEAGGAGAGAPSAAAGTIGGAEAIGGGLSLADVGAGSLLGSGTGIASGLSTMTPELVAQLQSLGYSGAEIAAAGGNALNGLGGGFAGGASGAGSASGGLLGMLNNLPGGLNKLLQSASPSLLQTLLGAGVQGLGSSLASRTQADAGQRAIDETRRQFDLNRSDLAPYRAAGFPALNRLSDLTTPGKQFTTMEADPGYQFRYDQGLNALNNRLKAGGKFYSGSALKGGQDYAQGMASQEFGNVFNRNAALAGVGQTATNAGIQSGNQLSSLLSNNMTDMGNARASGYVGIGNAIQGGLNSYNNQNYQNNLLQLLAGNKNLFGGA